MLLPVQSVGVMGDERTYESCVALRAVTSTDGMTADWVHLPYDFLAAVSNEIINRVRGVNRVVYDISSKPPATIEWDAFAGCASVWWHRLRWSARPRERVVGASEHQDGGDSANRAVGVSLSEQRDGTRRKPGFYFPSCDSGYWITVLDRAVAIL